MKTKNYKATFAACYLSIANQAVITNITAILFVPFMNLYGFSVWVLGLLVGINFLSQMAADTVLTFLIDKIHPKKLAIAAVSLSSVSLLAFALTPYLFASHMLAGLIIVTVFFSFSSGMLEVIISPIVDNIPDTSGDKGKAMSLMHSFYAWGQLLTIIVTSLFLTFAGYQYWNIIVFFWVLIPLIALFIFIKSPVETKQATEKKSAKKTLFSGFFIAAIFAIMLGGATEVIMNQYVATFLQLGLKLNKTVADLVGMGLFATFMGIGRVLHGKVGDRVNLSKTLMIGALIAAVLYITVGLVPVPWIAIVASVLCGFAVAILWPGTLVVASSKFPFAGMWLFAVLAVSGDIGGSVFPMITGFLAEKIGFNYAIALSGILPIGCFICHLILYKSGKKEATKLKDMSFSDGNTVVEERLPGNTKVQDDRADETDGGVSSVCDLPDGPAQSGEGG